LQHNGKDNSLFLSATTPKTAMELYNSEELSEFVNF
jgi:hypothetical protein